MFLPGFRSCHFWAVSGLLHSVQLIGSDKIHSNALEAEPLPSAFQEEKNEKNAINLSYLVIEGKFADSTSLWPPCQRFSLVDLRAKTVQCGQHDGDKSPRQTRPGSWCPHIWSREACFRMVSLCISSWSWQPIDTWNTYNLQLKPCERCFTVYRSNNPSKVPKQYATTFTTQNKSWLHINSTPLIIEADWEFIVHHQCHLGQWRHAANHMGNTFHPHLWDVNAARDHICSNEHLIFWSRSQMMDVDVTQLLNHLT